MGLSGAKASVGIEASVPRAEDPPADPTAEAEVAGEAAMVVYYVE